MLWRPHPGFQTRFLANSARECLGGGSAGPGKTDCLIYGGLRYADQPWWRLLFLRETYPQLQEAMDRTHRVFPSLGASWNGSERRWTFPSGGTFRFASAGSLADLVADHQGAEYTEIAWDELGLVADPQMWLWLQTRVRSSHPDAILRLRATANPGGPGNAWLRRRFVDPCGGGEGSYRDPVTGHLIAFVPGRLSDNPSIDSATRTDYRRSLEGQPEAVRRALLDGDWTVAEGLALGELEHAVHLVPQQAVPDWWVQWGGFDWGFAHWAVFVHLAQDADDRIWVVDTLWMRRLQPDQQAEMIWERVHVPKLTTIYGSKDCWDIVQARGHQGPTIAQTFLEQHLPLVPADNARVAGFSTLRELVSWRGRGPSGGDISPGLVFMDTPGNRKLLAQLETLVLDPKRPEDVLKVNADPSTGEGGDDGYDALRYGVQTHLGQVRVPKVEVNAFDPRMLALEMERTRKPRKVDRTREQDHYGLRDL